MPPSLAGCALLAALCGLSGAGPVRAAEAPSWLPRYDVEMDLDLERHLARVRLTATWTNPHASPTRQLVFNAHSRYVVPGDQVGLTAVTLSLLRMMPGEALGEKNPALEVHKITLLAPAAPGGPAIPAGELEFRYEGDTKTSLVVPLPRAVGAGESVTVALDITMHLPPKQGRWGQWRGVTYLSNWLPVFAFYGDTVPPPRLETVTRLSSVPLGQPEEAPPPRRLPDEIPAPRRLTEASWQPTPFVPWHQPFFNEAAHYRVRVTLPTDQQVACTGTVVASRPLADGRKQLDIQAGGVRDFAFLCSARYQCFEGEARPGPNLPPIRVHILAFPEHEHYARRMVDIVCQALNAYTRWFGPYPYPDFTIAEAFFGWNGNECSTLVMIDERVFGMPHLADGYVEYLVSHETCHQWWYNVVGTNGHCETWMDEGLATYFSHRLLNERYGRNNPLMHYPRGLEWLPNIRRDDYRSYSMYGTFGRGDNGPVVQAMTGYGNVINLFSLAYDKGSRVVGMIEDRIGEAAFFDFMRLVYTRYSYRILRVADFQRELETYTGYSWQEFFRHWLYGSGLSDWCVEKVKVYPAAASETGTEAGERHGLLCRLFGRRPDGPRSVRVTVLLHQKADYSDQTVLGFAIPGCEGYPIRVPILPQAGSYNLDNPHVHVESLPDNRVFVDVLLPDEPTQVAVDPDQVLIDQDPSNNFWKMPVRWRFAPLYTFLEETDLTNSYDRWNVLFGPWMYGASYNDAWYTRSTMLGVRAGLYRTQEFSGGAYAAYRTDFRDVVAGIDGLWDHWPWSHFQVGYNIERRLAEFYNGNNNALRGVLWGRYIFQYGASLYLPPMEYLESYALYQSNFLPFPARPIPGGERYSRTETMGLHYRKNYFVPYWDPEGGYQLDLYYEGGIAELDRPVGLNKLSSQLSFVKYLPDLSESAEGIPLVGSWAAPVLRWVGQTRLAMRGYGATSAPTRGEFFTIGGGSLFRGFDLTQKQGSAAWVASAELRIPLAKGLTWDFCDHVMGLRNVYSAVFYDAADVYINNHSEGPVAHGVGAGLRLDVSWFGFVERTLLRLDMAKAVNYNTPVQFWFGIQHPF